MVLSRGSRTFSAYQKKRAEKVSMAKFGSGNIKLLRCSSRSPCISAVKKVTSNRAETTCEGRSPVAVIELVNAPMRSTRKWTNWCSGRILFHLAASTLPQVVSPLELANFFHRPEGFGHQPNAPECLQCASSLSEPQL